MAHDERFFNIDGTIGLLSSGKRMREREDIDLLQSLTSRHDR